MKLLFCLVTMFAFSSSYGQSNPSFSGDSATNQMKTWLSDPANAEISSTRLSTLHTLHLSYMNSQQAANDVVILEPELKKLKAGIADGSLSYGVDPSVTSATVVDAIQAEQLLIDLIDAQVLNKNLDGAAADISSYTGSLANNGRYGSYFSSFANARLKADEKDFGGAEKELRALLSIDSNLMGRAYIVMQEMYADAGLEQKKNDILGEAASHLNAETNDQFDLWSRWMNVAKENANWADLVIAKFSTYSNPTMPVRWGAAQAYASKNDARATGLYESLLADTKVQQNYGTGLGTHSRAQMTAELVNIYESHGDNSNAIATVGKYFSKRTDPKFESGDVDVLKAINLPETDSAWLYFDTAQNVANKLKIVMRKQTGQLNASQMSNFINQLTHGTGSKVLTVSATSRQLAGLISSDSPLSKMFAQLFSGDYANAAKTAFTSAKSSSDDGLYADWIKALGGVVRVNDQYYNGRALDVIKFANGTTNVNPVVDLLGSQPVSLKK